MTDDDKAIAIALPGEWAIRKVLGPTLDEFGEDLKVLYAKGRDNIIAAARRKMPEKEDGKRANLRVARDVLWNGAFTDDEVCAEYFGGILAASRSKDGNNDDAIQFVDVIKSMSSNQLRLHYIIYRGLNDILITNGRKINVAQGSETQRCEIWFASVEIEQVIGLRLDTDPHVLHRLGLLWEYKTDIRMFNRQALPYFFVRPTSFGILLYAVAHNRLNEWRTFNSKAFGSLGEISMPKYFAETKDKLAAAVGLMHKS